MHIDIAGIVGRRLVDEIADFFRAGNAGDAEFVFIEIDIVEEMFVASAAEIAGEEARRIVQSTHG